jgi:hypothetical protein
MRAVAITLFLLFFVSFNVQAMEFELDDIPTKDVSEQQENNECQIIIHGLNEEGLKVADLIPLLNKTTFTKTHWCEVFLIEMAVAGVIFFLILIPAFLMPLIGCNSDSNDFNKFTPTPLCIAGLSLLGAPFLPCLVAPFNSCIVRAVNKKYRAEKRECQTKTEALRKGHAQDSELLSCDEIASYHELVAGDAKILTKLNIDQAMVLHKIDREKFRGLVYANALGPQVNFIGIKFLQLSDLSGQELSDALTQKDTYEKMSENPILFDLLIRFLPEDIDEKTKDSCRVCLKNIAEFRKLEVKNLDTVIQEIKAGNSFEASINRYGEKIEPRMITLKKDSNRVTVDLEILIEKVGYFKEINEGLPDTDSTWPTEIELPKYDNAIDIISTIINNKQLPAIDQYNVFDLLMVAAFYKIKPLSDACESYISENKLVEFVENKWIENKDSEYKNEYNDAELNKLSCYQNLCMLKLREELLLGFNTQLYSGAENDELYWRLTQLNDDQRGVIYKNFDKKKFYAVLLTPAKLKTISERVVAHNLYFLLVIIREFCNDNAHKDTVEKAWINIPNILKPQASNN